MFKFWIRNLPAAVFTVSVLTTASAFAQTAPTWAGHVTVVVELTLTQNSMPQQALVPISELRALMRKQPGYLSEELLQNLNATNAPHFVHVSRWVAIEYWSALFSKAEFKQYRAHGTEHYTLLVNAFQTQE